MGNQLDQNSSIPMYRQLANIIRNSVECGEFERGAQIPTESILSQQYEISRITVRKALDELTEEGLLTRLQGKGTFVASGKAINDKYPFMTFKDACALAGQAPSTRLLSYSMELPSKKGASFFEIADSDKVIQIRRLKVANEIPVIVETDYFLNEFTFLAEEPLVESTTSILNKHNVFPLHGESTISLCYANAEESDLLNLDQETPLIYVYSEIKDQNFRPIQISKQIIRSELYQLVLTF